MWMKPNKANSSVHDRFSPVTPPARIVRRTKSMHARNYDRMSNEAIGSSPLRSLQKFKMSQRIFGCRISMRDNAGVTRWVGGVSWAVVADRWSQWIVIMFESLVSRLTSPPVSRRRHTVHTAREVCSEPEEEAAAPAQRRSRTAKHLLDKRRKARLSCADLTAATNAEPERSRMDALKAFLPLRQSKSLGRLDGLKEVSCY